MNTDAFRCEAAQLTGCLASSLLVKMNGLVRPAACPPASRALAKSIAGSLGPSVTFEETVGADLAAKGFGCAARMAPAPACSLGAPRRRTASAEHPPRARAARRGIWGVGKAAEQPPALVVLTYTPEGTPTG